jgi:hypothetical protein
MQDHSVESWGARPLNKFVLSLPLHKFAMGCASYIVSVMLLSYKDLEGSTVPRTFCLVVGIMSMSSVVLTCGVLLFDKPVIQKGSAC